MSQKNGDKSRFQIARKRAVLRRASALAAQYRLMLEPHEEVGYIGTALEMPGVMADGGTPNRCVAQLREALVLAVAVMLEKGESPPTPATGRQRNQQINIRLTAEEKRMLEEAAESRQFRGISDFVRAAALDSIHPRK